MRRFRSAALAPVAVIGFASIASAADLPRKAPAYAPPPPPVYSWAGFYVGGNVGYSWGKVDTTANESGLTALGLPTTFTDPLKPNGIIGGGQIGYNWQASRNWVFGIEADFQGSGQKHSNSFSIPFLVSGPPPGPGVPGNIITSGTLTTSHEEKLEWFGTVRGRIGYAWDNVMVYATGGLAYGHVESALASTATFSIPPVPPAVVSFSDSKTKAGWTVGGGIEGAFFNTRNWTWKVEYLYVDLGTVDPFVLSPTLGVVTISNKVTDNIVRVGINYRFY